MLGIRVSGFPACTFAKVIKLLSLFIVLQMTSYVRHRTGRICASQQKEKQRRTSRKQHHDKSVRSQSRVPQKTAG